MLLVEIRNGMCVDVSEVSAVYRDYQNKGQATFVIVDGVVLLDRCYESVTEANKRVYQLTEEINQLKVALQ